jgi:hypothetical protein
MNLPLPNSQKTDVLRSLILNDKGLSERDKNYNRFRGTISDLRKVLTIKYTDVPFTSVFGFKNKYRRHYLSDLEKKKAIKIYLKWVS